MTNYRVGASAQEQRSWSCTDCCAARRLLGGGLEHLADALHRAAGDRFGEGWPAARFFLHDTYSQPLIIIRKRNPHGELVLQDVYAYGVYVIGCQVLTSDRKWHSLEFDLASLMQLPVEIRKR